MVEYEDKEEETMVDFGNEGKTVANSEEEERNTREIRRGGRKKL